MVSKRSISRRQVLHAGSALLGLPFMPSLSAQAQSPSNALGPKRLAFFYVPNGIHMANWRVKKTGPLVDKLPEILSPLESLKSNVSVVTGLAADHCNGNGAAHEPAGGGFLVGKKCKHSEEPEVGGVSIDQLVAQQIGYLTPVDSLALGIDPGHRGDHGYSGTYMSHISWRNKTTPAPLTLNPRELYTRLFSDGINTGPRTTTTQPILPPDSIDATVLDLVREEAKRVQKKLSSSDKRKLEEYLEGVRSVERRIARASASNHSHHQDAFNKDPALHNKDPKRPTLIIPQGKGIPSDYAEHVNLMLDLLVLAFQTDSTRVASFMFSYEKSGRSYPQIKAPGAHHSTSHHGGKAENHRELTNINRHHVELFARMLGKLNEIREGEHSLLDNTMMVYGSGICDGNAHNHDDLPILLAGGKNCQLKLGQHLKFNKKVPLCNLYVSILSRMGIEQKSFGDSTGVINELS